MKTDQGLTPADPTVLWEENQKTGRRRQLVSRVLLALVAGSVLAHIIISIPRGLYGTGMILIEKREVYIFLVSAGISWFVGGFFSGWIVEFEVRHRRWRFLWLAVASPALPTWLIAVWEATTQQHISDFRTILVIVMVLAAFAGSAAGYWTGYRRRMRWRRKWGGRIK